MDIELRMDPTGFPMIKLAANKYIHWLPVTKVQFEYFMCDSYDDSFDTRWYEQVLALNPRVPPGKISSRDYWRAFISGILPAEAQRFGFWCGEGYRLPSAEEWAQAYQVLSSHPAQDLETSKMLEGLPSRHRELILRTDIAASEAARRMGYIRRLADQMLMRLGFLEWVANEERWGAIGEPFPDLCGNLMTPERGELVLPREPDRVRLPCLGIRLLFTEQI
jgi:hypothetical protein